MAVRVQHHKLEVAKTTINTKIESDDPEDNPNPINQYVLKSIVSKIDTLEDINKNL